MRCITPKTKRGTVSLIALCFVAVLGITLTGYIAVCSRAMNLSNRSFQNNLSRQLAEMGLDEAMRAFNKNDWADWTNGGLSANWTISGTTATCDLTFPAAKFGQGVTGSVKIRVDNYNAAQLNSTWNATTTYRVNDTVGYSGSWYRCVRTNSGQTPAGLANMGYWVPEPIPAPLWDATFTYKAEDVVYYTSTNSWYRCILAPTANQTPANTTYWTAISKISLDGGYWGINGEILNYFGLWYYNVSSSWRDTPNPPYSYAPVVSWCWRQGYAYAFNDLVGYGYPLVWYRCKVAHTSSGSILPTNTTYWENALTGSMWGWNSSLNYNLGDAVYYSGSWYRCIAANINKTPSSYPANWSTSPLLPREWNSGKQYSQNDTVRHNGVWYLSLQNSNSNQNPVTATTYWIGANTTTTSYQWNATTGYSAGDYRCYGGIWYKCASATTANAGHSPNNTTYWTAAWANASGVTTGAPVVYAEGTIVITGSPSIRTQLRAAIAPAPLFPNAAAATTTISASSGGTVDSYDSTTGVAYASQVGTATNYSAVLAAGNTSSTAVTLSGALTVSGYVAAPSASSPSPYAPLFSYGTSTIVKGTSATPSPKVDLSRVSRSPYIPQFDTLPAGGLATNWASTPKGTALSAGSTVSIGTPGATASSRYYYNGNLVMGGGSSVIATLNINGPVILYINGDLTMTGGPNGIMNITSTGSAEIHIAGGLKVDSGSDGIVNSTSDPKNLILICDNSGTTTQFYSEGANVFQGVIYMPKTTATNGLYFNQGDTNSTTVYGAASATKITYQNNAILHYDTSLRYATFGGVDQPYTITEWRELPVTEQATMP